MATLDRDADSITILVRFSGDISTKAPATKQRFHRRLAQNVADALRSNEIRYRIRRTWDRFLVDVDSPHALDVLPRVFGVQSISRVESYPYRTLEDVVRAGEEVFAGEVEGKRFAVRSRRSGHSKDLPFRSSEIEKRLGTVLLSRAAGVDLGNPEVTAHVEVQRDRVYFFRDKIPAQGGLPVGVGGRALSLVSGGFDSAVSSWLLLKRGIALQYLFFNLGGDAHREGVLRVMKAVSDHWSYGSSPRLIEVDFQDVVREIRESTNPRYWQVLLKRLMIRAADLVADRVRCAALVTGEALGQVSSQTLPNLAVISRASERTIFRPLIGFNKDQIIAIARTIGTYEHSAGVEEYCALLARNPSTRARLAVIEEEESRLDLDRLAGLVDDRTVWILRDLEVDWGIRPEIETDAPDPGDTVIDLRSRAAFDAWHWPGSVHLDFGAALASWGALDRGKRYVFVCEVGLKSAHLAEVLARAGVPARHIRGGVKTLLRQDPAADLLLG